MSGVAADWHGREVSFDPDGEADFGSLEFVSFMDGTLRYEGDWGQVRVACGSVEVALGPD